MNRPEKLDEPLVERRSPAHLARGLCNVPLQRDESPGALSLKLYAPPAK